MTTAFTIVAGKVQTECPPRDTWLSLALRIVDAAHALGFKTSLKTSRSAISCTRRIEMVDSRGQAWLIRVSNHRVPANTGRAIPHLDLVSHDGMSGEDQVRGFLTQMASGTLLWFDPGRSPWMKRTGKRGRR